MSANLRAFLALIRWCEGTAGPDGYRTLFGGELFDGYADHPRKAITRMLGGKPLTSTAAGAYQFLSRTWDECKARLTLPDFSPESQDLAATFLVKRRGALDDVEAGRLDEALAKCALEWASLPGSPYGQPTKTLAQCREMFIRAGGYLADGQFSNVQSGSSTSEFVPHSIADIVTGKEPSMPAPFILAAASALLDSVPTLIRFFGKGQRSEDNAKLAETIVPIAKQAVGATNEQDVIEKLNDPALLAKIDQAMREALPQLIEAGGGGIQGARDWNDKIAASGAPVWKQPAFLVTMALLPLVYLTVFWVLKGGMDFSGELKAAIASAVVAGVLGAITGFWLGSSFTTSASRGIGSKPAP